MYYESYQKKPRRRRPRAKRRTFGEWLAQGLLKLLALLLIAALLCAGLLYALPPGTFLVEPEGGELALTDGLPASCINVLLLGTDVLRSSMQRSDAVLIASVGYGKLKLTSVLRDTVVDIPGHGQGKLNAAFAYGGAELAMRTLNQTFGLNIMHYAQVDFVALVKLVDAIGGVEIDLTDAERDRLNLTLRGSGKIFAPLGYTAHEVTASGENIHLDGLQALSYARIRKIDSDFVRTSRQRKLLNAMLKKIRSSLWNPALWVRLGRAVLESVHTNMSPLQILSLGEKALLAGGAEQLRLPVDGSYTDNGSKITIDNRTANRDAFYRFVYES
ncbi:MAG: LCP family protein [Clostridia bacterium]|nr:LCP family protein [Clostridia bacterium]